MTLSGIDHATFQFVAQCLNHCATSSVPPEYNIAYVYILFFSLYLHLASYRSFYDFLSRYMRLLIMTLTHTTNPVSLHEMIFRNATFRTALKVKFPL
jgi:hypothetical protein